VDVAINNATHKSLLSTRLFYWAGQDQPYPTNRRLPLLPIDHIPKHKDSQSGLRISFFPLGLL
jgi:hypothetical protein